MVRKTNHYQLRCCRMGTICIHKCWAIKFSKSYRNLLVHLFFKNCMCSLKKRCSKDLQIQGFLQISNFSNIKRFQSWLSLISWWRQGPGSCDVKVKFVSIVKAMEAVQRSADDDTIADNPCFQVSKITIYESISTDCNVLCLSCPNYNSI